MNKPRSKTPISKVMERDPRRGTSGGPNTHRKDCLKRKESQVQAWPPSEGPGIFTGVGTVFRVSRTPICGPLGFGCFPSLAMLGLWYL